MSKHQSKRKQRQSDRIPLEVKACSDVRAIASKPFVVAVEDHFAGYFNELGLTVTVIEAASDYAVITLRNELLHHLDSLLPKGASPFCWQVAFKRAGKTIEVLLQGDDYRETTDELSPT